MRTAVCRWWRRGRRADLQHGLFGGERGTQFVGGVGDEAPLRMERCLEPPEQAVERLAELPELVVGAGNGEALAQVPGGDVAGGCRDAAQGPKDPAGDQPADAKGEDGHDRGHDHAGDVLPRVADYGSREGRDAGVLTTGAQGMPGGRAAGSDQEVGLEDHRDGGDGDAGEAEHGGVQQGELRSQGAPGQAERGRAGRGRKAHHWAPIW